MKIEILQEFFTNLQENGISEEDIIFFANNKYFMPILAKKMKATLVEIRGRLDSIFDGNELKGVQRTINKKAPENRVKPSVKDEKQRSRTVAAVSRNYRNVSDAEIINTVNAVKRDLNYYNYKEVADRLGVDYKPFYRRIVRKGLITPRSATVLNKATTINGIDIDIDMINRAVYQVSQADNPTLDAVAQVLQVDVDGLKKFCRVNSILDKVKLDNERKAFLVRTISLNKKNALGKEQVEKVIAVCLQNGFVNKEGAVNISELSRRCAVSGSTAIRFCLQNKIQLD